MITSNKKQIVSIVIALFVLSGCSGLSQTDVSKLTNTTTGTSQTINGLNFSKISDTNVALFNQNINQASQTNQGNGASSQTAVTSNQSTGATSDMASQQIAAPSVSGKMSSLVAQNFPQTGFFENYVVTDFEEATKAGYKGTYLATLNNIIKPIIKDLAPDSRLVSSNGNADKNGVNLTPVDSSFPEGYFGTSQWYFNFVSSSQKEIYSITVSEKETLVMRQKWGLADMSFDKVTIDSNKAIEIALKNIKDKSVKPSYDQVEDTNPQYSSQILYAPPSDLPSSWNFYLEQDKTDLIWSISLSIFNQNNNNVIMYAKDATTTVSGSASETTTSNATTVSTKPTVEKKMVTNVWYEGGYIRINAATGEIVSFSRPMKHTNTYEEYVSGTGSSSSGSIAVPPVAVATSVNAL